MPNQQNKPRMAPANTPPARTQQCRPAGGTDDDNPSQAAPGKDKGTPTQCAGQTLRAAQQNPRPTGRPQQDPNNNDSMQPATHARAFPP